ncbi:MAG: hypothetical protein Q4C98_02520 [Capnocytophaga sp.]|nr:hypothetical protein [Capnocytophaga sp.]
MNKPDYYLQSLQTLVFILEENNETHWANWLKRDINYWQTEQSTKIHRSAYGGMGCV